MFLTILVLSHILCFIIIVKLSVIMHNYLIKKPSGLQSILDLLILDLIKVNLFNIIVFTFGFLLPGSLYGKLDYFTAQIIVFILINCRIFVCLLFQNFLMTKAILVFKEHWLNNMMDNELLWISRMISIFLTCARFCLDFWITGTRAGPMTKFLTGTKLRFVSCTEIYICS